MKTFGIGTLIALSSALMACTATPIGAGDLASTDTTDAPTDSVESAIVRGNDCSGFVPETSDVLISHAEGNREHRAIWNRVKCTFDKANKTGKATYHHFIGSKELRVDVDLNIHGQFWGAGVTVCPMTQYECSHAADRLLTWLNGDNRPPLFALHSGCWDASRARSSDCTAAANLFCWRQGYRAGIVANAANAGNGIADIACFQPSLYRAAAYSELRSYIAGCSDAQSIDCLAAIHRICNATGSPGGVAQQLGATEVAFGCASSGVHQILALNALPGCTQGNTAGMECTNAITNHCRAQGHAGGIAQEVGPGAVLFMCFDGGTFATRIR